MKVKTFNVRMTQSDFCVPSRKPNNSIDECRQIYSWTPRVEQRGGGLGDEEYWPCLTKYFIVRIMFPKSFNRNYFDQIHVNNTARRKVSTLEWQMSSLRASQSNIILNCVLLDFYYYVSLTRPYSYAVRPWQYTSLRNDDNVCMLCCRFKKRCAAA